MRKWLRDNAHLLLVLLIVMAARSSLADHYVVPSGSMEPTLLPGDRVLVDKRAYGLRLPFTDFALTERARPEAGDVVIFDSPHDGTRLIKRVVAVAGDRVSLREGRLAVNGRTLEDPAQPWVERFGDHRVTLDLTHGGGPDIAPTSVPAGHVMVLGDSRGQSSDSRYFGFVNADTLYARALRVFHRDREGFVWRRLSPER